ncbi:hypothetical protein P5673_029657 [Acropora cervicornis]|uniref:C2H2-type domain-containing protein n=1 Tax=Acropora cervicornis TaxID=6130 RepID=A0AAD9PWB3_ACRCE|nr:hypothetical protein P5673_029657 [Acropora cervicornis]
MPFGERTLRLSSKTPLKIPNVIRASIPEQTVRQYQSYCKEKGLKPISQSSLFRILHVCSVSLHKPLQGLDYVSSEGAQAFHDIAEVADKLGDNYQGGMSWSEELIRKLKLMKRYLKGDFKVSPCITDHCRPYALSYSSYPGFTQRCEHPHDLACDRCNLFPAIFQEIESVLETIEIPLKKREELKYTIMQSRETLKHDEARIAVFNALKEQEVLVVLDWTMKFLHSKYHESQADWYGKRGISWHISVATRKCKGDIEMLTLIHVFESCCQDSIAVLAVIENVVKQLKEKIPDNKSVIFRQDNAGCYHSAATMLGLKQLACQQKAALRMDSSDPQGGKGPCDQKAATVKSHMRTFLNSGNELETVKQMKTAIESGGDYPHKQGPKLRWEGMSFVNNFTYERKGMRVWRAYGIGKGKFLPRSDFQDLDNIFMPHLTVIKDTCHLKQPLSAIRACKSSSKESSTTVLPDPEYEDSDVEQHGSTVGLFTCIEEGCVKSFQRFSSLQNHLDLGKHNYVLDRETFLDQSVLNAPNIVSEEEEDGNIDKAAAENYHQLVRKEAFGSMSIQHPIMYDTFNICEMASALTLSKFSISMLQEICEQYELDTSGIRVKRKKPSIEVLTDFVKMCSCGKM